MNSVLKTTPILFSENGLNAKAKNIGFELSKNIYLQNWIRYLCEDVSQVNMQIPLPPLNRLVSWHCSESNVARR